MSLTRICSVVAAMTVIACAGCGGHPTQPSRVSPGQPFDLRTGASERLWDGLTVTFAGVRSDSRCPMDALCVWVGDAVVAVSLTPPFGASAERELHTQPGGSEVVYLGRSITLVALTPYPRSDRQIRAEDYVATLMATSR